MNPERNLSGFTFYMPEPDALEGYEVVLSDEGEASRSSDLAAWIARLVTTLDGMQTIILLYSDTAMTRGGKGYDIEMSAWCRERCGVPVIAAGGVATVKHVLNFELHGKAAGMVLPDAVYDGSFSLHDVRAFVEEEVARQKERGSRLSLGVLGGGKLAGSDINGHYWQQGNDHE